MTSFYRIAVAVFSSGSLSALLLSQKDRFRAYASSQGEPHATGSVWDYNWDRRNPESGKEEGEGVPPKPTATRHLILIRHGQYEHWHSEQEKKVLTELGRQQATATGQRLKELETTYSAIHHSTMPRAVETAQLVSQCLPEVPMHSCDLLREGAPIVPEPPVHHWRPEKHEFFCDGPRIEAAFRKYFHRAPPTQEKNSTEVVVCHANVIRYFVCRALQLPPEAWLRISLGNGSITKIAIRPNGRVSLKTLGNTGHFPPKLLTFN